MAGGGENANKHYYDTIKNRQSVESFSKFLSSDEVEKLQKYSHGRPYAVWGAIPGPSNLRNWEAMEDGDYVMVYRQGKIILAAEIAMKVRNPGLAKHFWQEDSEGKTWELVYFLINDVEVDVDIEKLNKYFGYEPNYHPQGFMAIQQAKVDKALLAYGDLISLLQKLERNENIEEIEKVKIFNSIVEEKIEKAPTEHSEMQWRLIRLGNKANFDVWVPEADKGRSWNGEVFSNMVIDKFHETIDVPTYIKNIDTVWKLGHSIKSAFEIENSTSIYSGILRLSDLRALAPNSNYPLFIVAQREKRNKVFEQLRRPTFSNDYLALNKAVKFLSYDSVREMDENIKESQIGFNIDWLNEKAEAVAEEA
jgi:hypothetical protein